MHAESTVTPTPLQATFTPSSFSEHFSSRPYTLTKRLLQTFSTLLPALASQRPGLPGDPDAVTAALERLGPAWIKLGQQLSTRPDLLPQRYVKSLARLRDGCAPFPDEVAKGMLSESGFEFTSPLIRISTASLGQVYKSTIAGDGGSGDDVPVAVKVQRPGIREPYALDLYCGLVFAAVADAVLPAVTKQKPWHVAFVTEFCRGSYTEVRVCEKSCEGADTQLRFFQLPPYI